MARFCDIDRAVREQHHADGRHQPQDPAYGHSARHHVRHLPQSATGLPRLLREEAHRRNRSDAVSSILHVALVGSCIFGKRSTDMLSLFGNSFTESTISQIIVTHCKMKLNVNHVAEIKSLNGASERTSKKHTKNRPMFCDVTG